jgi:hypothetical protein
MIADAYGIGRRAKFLLGLRLHEMLALPISEARRACGLTQGAAVVMTPLASCP